VQVAVAAVMGTGAVAALSVGAATGQAAIAGWPMVGHDAGLSSRSAAQSAQRPVLAVGWPRPGFPHAFDLSKQLLTTSPQPLVGANGALVLGGGPTTAILNANGSIRQVLPIGPISGIDPAGNLVGFAGEGYAVASYTPQGRARWTVGIFGHSAADRSLVVAPNGNSYALTGEWSLTVISPTGLVLWSATELNLTGGPPTTMAVAPDGTLYVVARDSSSLLQARHPDGTVAWPSPPTLPGAIGQIAVAPDGSLRVVDGQYLSAVAADGQLLWSVPMPTASGIAIAADGTTIVSASGAPPSWPYYQPPIGSVAAVSPAGTMRWRISGRFVPGNPLIGGDGTIYMPGAPLVALRPDGTQLFALAAGTPLVPKAIGTDGTLYAGELVGGGAPIVALASPSVRAGSVVPSPAALNRIISPLSMTVRFRTHGAAVTCPTPGHPCSPLTSLGSMVSFTLRSNATVLFTVRRASDGRPVTHTAQRLLSGTTWEELTGGIYPDSAYIFPQSLTAKGGPLRPGRYTITVRASAGSSAVQTRPVSFVILN